IVTFLDEAALRDGAMVALFRYGGAEGNLLASECLQEALRSEDPGERQRAAMVLGAVGSASVHQLLTRLLEDPDLSVRRAALKATSKMDTPIPWPVVLAQLNVPELERPAQAALAAAGQRCFPAIDAVLQAGLPAQVRLRLYEVL